MLGRAIVKKREAALRPNIRNKSKMLCGGRTVCRWLRGVTPLQKGENPVRQPGTQVSRGFTADASLLQESKQLLNALRIFEEPCEALRGLRRPLSVRSPRGAV